MSARRLPGFVFVKTASGLVIPFKPPKLDPESAAAREAEREPSRYLLTTPGQAYAGYVRLGADGEPELWLEPVDDLAAAADEIDAAAAAEAISAADWQA